jgi:hypothetical protein
MLAPYLVAEVRRLLAEGKLSRRRIARSVGVSRGTVHDIALRKRPGYDLRAEPAEGIEPAAPPVRCPGCGGMIYLPCRLCEARRAAQRGRLHPQRLPEDATGEEPLSLELKEAHRLRYERVRAQREAAALADNLSPIPPSQERRVGQGREGLVGLRKAGQSSDRSPTNLPVCLSHPTPPQEKPLGKIDSRL